MASVNRPLRTVLIFAHECAPYHRPQSTIGAQRPAQFAKYLPEFGWRAVVVCCDLQTRGKGTRTEIQDLTTHVRGLVRSADPMSSLIIPTPSFAWNGLLDLTWRQLLPKAGRDSALRKVLRKPLTAAKLMTGDYSQPWQPFGRRAAAAVAQEVPIAACIAEHSPDAGLFLARWFSRRYGVPWGADFRDPILQPLKPFARKIYAPVARRLLSTAVFTTTVTPIWAEMDEALLGVPACSVPNGFDPAEFEPPVGQIRNERFTIAYAGNIIAAQHVAPFLDGLAKAAGILGPDNRNTMRFTYCGGAYKRIEGLVRDRGIEDVVDIRGHIDRDEALAGLKRADVLLLLSIAKPEQEDRYLQRGHYPGKTFECFGARRPILCIPGDRGLLDELIYESRTGVVRRTPDEIADYILAAWQDWKDGTPLEYRPNDAVVSPYTRRNLTGRLARLLDHVVGAAPAQGAAAASPREVAVEPNGAAHVTSS